MLPGSNAAIASTDSVRGNNVVLPVILTAKRSSRGRWVCRACKYQSTVTAGTIFDKTRTDLRVWFAAIWYITNQKHGVSALGLQRVLGLGSYETAWTMLHRLRRAMVRPSRELLTGEVEVDETYLALTEREKPKPRKGFKSNTTKVLVVIAVEILQPKGFGRIRVRRIEKADSITLVPFIRESIDTRASIHTDGSTAYKKLNDEGYDHRRTVHLGSDIQAHDSMPGVHRVAALLQHWLLGTHHGAIQPKQLDITWMNSFFALIVELQNHGAYYFIDCFSRQLWLVQSHTKKLLVRRGK